MPIISLETIDKINKNEKGITNLFSTSVSFDFNGHKIERFFDRKLPDMYYHNFTISPVEIDDKLLEKILKIKEENNEKHCKISLPFSTKYLIFKGFKQEITLTMVKENYDSFNVVENGFVKFSSVRKNPEYINDVIAIEIEYYGEYYGIDFCVRRWNRYFDKIREGDNGLNLFVALFNKQVIGYCYTFYSDGVVGLDGLLVKKEFRNQYVASNLIKHVANFYKCPIYLHADEEDTPKIMYEKLGFVTINKSYDYLKLDEEK